MHQNDTKGSGLDPLIGLNVAEQPGKLLFSVGLGSIKSCVDVGIIILVFSCVEDEEVDRSRIEKIVKLTTLGGKIIVETARKWTSHFVVPARKDERLSVVKSFCDGTQELLKNLIFAVNGIKGVTSMDQEIDTIPIDQIQVDTETLDIFVLSVRNKAESDFLTLRIRNSQSVNWTLDTEPFFRPVGS
jgi:hypothetical protein